jgi:hypothetical protein
VIVGLALVVLFDLSGSLSPRCGEAAGQILAEQDAGFPRWYLRKTVLPRVEMCCCYFGRTGKVFLRSFVCLRGIISGPYITYS